MLTFLRTYWKMPVWKKKLLEICLSHWIWLMCLQESEKYSLRMPNKWNFSFDYFYAAILVLGFYVPGKNSYPLISWMHTFNLLLWVYDSSKLDELCILLQAVLTCIVICLHRGRKRSQNPRVSSIYCSNSWTFIFLLWLELCV